MEQRLIFACKNDDPELIAHCLREDAHTTDTLLCNDGVAVRLIVQHGRREVFTLFVNHHLRLAEEPHGYDTTEYNIRRFRLKRAIADALRSHDPGRDAWAYLRERQLVGEHQP